MKILGDVISPFVRMCLVTAHEAGLKDKVSLVATHAKMAEANRDLQKINPLGKIPVLVTDHGHAIHDSRVIMEYLAHVSGHGELIPNDGVARFWTLTLAATAQGAADAAVLLRYETFQRPEDKRWPDYVARLTQRIIAALDEIEANWSHGLEKNSVNVGSIAVACMLGYLDFRHAALDWRKGRPKLTAFSEAFNARESMRAWPLG